MDSGADTHNLANPTLLPMVTQIPYLYMRLRCKTERHAEPASIEFHPLKLKWLDENLSTDFRHWDITSDAIQEGDQQILLWVASTFNQLFDGFLRYKYSLDDPKLRSGGRFLGKRKLPGSGGSSPARRMSNRQFDCFLTSRI
ncbi:hypothetical protein J6590_004783 [Homalodisca vitripennis]|nr:hypothetical protein J6590_004783 [Homalodisca vitripennis]